MKHYEPSAVQAQFPLSGKKVIKGTLLATFKTVFTLALPILFIGGAFFWLWIKETDVAQKQKLVDLWGNVSPYLFSVWVLVVLVGFFALTYLYQYGCYVTYFYNLTDEYVIIKKGLLAPHEITVPYERIQDIYVDQDLLDRIFGLYDVHISSATQTSGVRAHIDGVEKKAAEGLREMILKRVQTKTGKKVG